MSKQMLMQGVLSASTPRAHIYCLLNIASNPHDTWELNIIAPILQLKKNGRCEVCNLAEATEFLNSRAGQPQTIYDFKLTQALLLGRSASGMFGANDG